MEFLLSALASGGVAAVLLAIAGFLGRSQLSHWLAKDLEAIKAQHQRDLEYYKVGLIAETERAKATQEIKKAAAVMVAEKEFNAFNELHLASHGIAKLIVTHWKSTAKVAMPWEFQAMRSQLQRLEHAADGCLIFLQEQKDRTKLQVYKVRLSKLLGECENPHRFVDGDDADEKVHALLTVEVAVDGVVKSALQRLRAME